MSWEVDRISEQSCDCGAGIFKTIYTSNDWGKCQSGLVIMCEACELSRRAIRQRRAELKEQVSVLARSRHLANWLSLFEGQNRKQVWYRLTGGSGYPSLGTFYNHVKDEGLQQYLSRVFRQDISAALSLMGVYDEEVTNMLDELNSLPDHNRRYPMWM